MKTFLTFNILLASISTNIFAQNNESKFENKTSYEIIQENSDTTYSLKIKDPKSGITYGLLNGKIKPTESFEEKQGIPEPIKILEIDFDKKGLKEIVLEYSIEYTTQKGESGADSKKKIFIKIINLDKKETLLDYHFHEVNENFFYARNYNEDFVESSDYNYEYKNNKGSNYYISDSKIYFIDISENTKKGKVAFKYNKAKGKFEK
ncbi:hypothetical protein [Runella aurantiaca]|uniref:Cadherin domain-containing protein n=1 Tax=Runella aurantiaca TaxID=2282308 RepID=A0A369I5H8_9BACT|nr:hypothetical protein [Runella aurantiaca]RDB02444.1 hypothetical protein DVG78_28785 [Runella aurantiaca]